MLPAIDERRLTAMTITFATHTITDGVDQPAAAEFIVLDDGFLFQPSAVVERAHGLAAGGVPLTVSMSLDVLDRAPLSGVSRRLIEASAESRLRQALHTAGYRFVTRRAVVGVIVLDASV